jgi:hypothetical protein
MNVKRNRFSAVRAFHIASSGISSTRFQKSGLVLAIAPVGAQVVLKDLCDLKRQPRRHVDAVRDVRQGMLPRSFRAPAAEAATSGVSLRRAGG